MSGIPTEPAELTRLRPLGSLEKYMTTRSNLGIYYKVAVTTSYRCNPPREVKSILFNALADVISQHPILSAIPVGDPATPLCFGRLPRIDLNQVVEFVEISKISDEEGKFSPSALDRFLEEQHNCPFKYTTPLSPFWRLYKFQGAQDPSIFILSLFFHHCIADTKSALVLHEAIETAMNEARGECPDGLVESTDIPLLPPLDHFIDGTLPVNPVAREAPPSNEWTGARQFIPVKTRFRSHLLSADTTHHLVAVSRKKQLSLTATLQNLLIAALFRCLPAEYDILTADCPVSLRLWLPAPIASSSVGCFIDNFSTVYHRSPFNWDEVRRTKEMIDTVLENKRGDNLCGKVSKLPDLEAWFERRMGQPRDSGLEFSNVGRLTSRPASAEYKIETVLFSQSAGACSGAIKVSGATGRDGRMTLGLSWQEGVVEDGLVTGLISELTNVLGEALRE